VQVAGAHCDAANGVEASQVRPVYEHLRRLYGGASDAN
jgi:hypothetical protein